MSCASCCIIGRTRTDTLKMHADWLVGWFKHALKSMETAAELSRSIAATSKSDAQRIIASEIHKELTEGYLDKNDEGRSLRDSVVEIGEKLEKDSVPQDFFTFRHVINTDKKDAKNVRLTLIPRMFFEDRVSSESDIVTEKVIEDYSKWFGDYLFSLKRRSELGTMTTSYEDTIFLPKEIIPSGTDCQILTDLQVRTLKMLDEFVNSTNVWLSIVTDESGKSFRMSPSDKIDYGRTNKEPINS